MMVGQTTVNKPSRSDDVLDASRQLQITNQTRAHFDSLAPKRPSKPNRSEPDTTQTTAPALSHQNCIPELDKLRSLQSQSPVVFTAVEGANSVQEEFVETGYYKELDSVDKQHHKTGSGFIRTVIREETENSFGIQLQDAAGSVISGYRSNPATNDWTPCLEDDRVFVSSKPNRSESY